MVATETSRSQTPNPPRKVPRDRQIAWLVGQKNRELSDSEIIYKKYTDAQKGVAITV